MRQPDPNNGFLSDHVAILVTSFRSLGLGDLIASQADAIEMAQRLFEAPFAVVSHDAAADPVFNYGNRKALELFEMGWKDFTRLPSRLSTEPLNQAERNRLLETVRGQGFINDYQGVRISATGRRFRIEHAVVWNLSKPDGSFYGQAACFSRWAFLS